MTSPAIVERFDVVEDGRLQRPARWPSLTVEEFGLQGSPEALGSCVVVGVSHGAHGAEDTSLAEALAEGERAYFSYNEVRQPSTSSWEYWPSGKPVITWPGVFDWYWSQDYIHGYDYRG